MRDRDGQEHSQREKKMSLKKEGGKMEERVFEKYNKGDKK